MSTSAPGWMPTKIIAWGKINLDKLKAAHIWNSVEALIFPYGFCFWAAWLQLKVVFFCCCCYSFAKHSVSKKALVNWIKFEVGCLRYVGDGVNCIPKPYKVVISEYTVATAGKIYLINFNWGKSSLLPFPKAHTSFHGLIMLLMYLTQKAVHLFLIS